MRTSKFINSINIDESWKPFLNRQEVIEELFKIEQRIGSNYTPPAPLVLRFATTDLKTIKVIMIGKDPYPEKGIATGRSFEVNGVKDWNDKQVSRCSLRNIIKLLHKTYLGYEKAKGIKEIRKDIQSGKFPIPSPDQVFSYWERQGVLFLNTAFTCEIGKIGSHLNDWKCFFRMLLTYIVSTNKNIRFFLWGKESRKYSPFLTKLGVSPEYLYESTHPCNNRDDGDYQKGTNFLNNPCFKDTLHDINWTL
ncbi:uracil-DNA glycosylase [Bacillus sp. FSL W8-1127]|uniref:uracil-DNA glycosylase n=1 Tax=Bacillus TaxID=1386 RepID=UPI002E1A4DC3|nr:uracil-DNA glycosylase [Bacillus smithii]MED4929113.1 uracil-DNA glycosylase [Bacillus smithii]